MNKEDLYTGQMVRVINWEEEMDEDGDPYDYRPEHWCEDGDMDDWQGEVVTIREISYKSDHVWIEEDEQRWQWYPWDFHHHCLLSNHDPNLVYKRAAYRKKIDGMKKEWKSSPTYTMKYRT